MDLDSKIFLITGANSGIGFETAKALVKLKARIIFACRDLNKGNAAIEEIRKEQPTGGELVPVQLDLASFDSIEKFVERIKADFPRIDVLINNAGVSVPIKEDQRTKEGFEIHFGTNHLGHFYLTNLLLDVLKKSAPSRALAEKLQGTGVDVVACCPGLCSTNMQGRSYRWYQYFIMFPVMLFAMHSPQKGAETVVLCATGEIESAKFYRNSTEYKSWFKFDKDTETKLWKVSEELVKARRPL